MPNSSSDHGGIRKKMRKGTHSCFECKSARQVLSPETRILPTRHPLPVFVRFLPQGKSPLWHFDRRVCHSNKPKTM
ncbi:hypothetical protein K402DRAFT_392588 [Aulographum hederae CBS 113979]|uniref:Uncharacterized protein n=1 Tax=Aulographum hederae CBS 113979 TaxID=1176131 RepID=A0A6G1H496_9PEZI|nr:hypothetical protein K402DRAFT_392588 [Aulographum hederae CBS 113979]